MWFVSVPSFRTRAGRRPAQKRRTAKPRLLLEPLEDRWLLSFTLGALAKVGPTDPFAGCSGVNLPNVQVEPRLAVDPTNPAHMVGVWMQDHLSTGGVAGIVAGVSFDAGVHWTEVVIPGLTQCTGGNSPSASDPWITIGPTGIVYSSTLLLTFDSTGQVISSSVAASRSTNRGLTWSQPTNLLTVGPNSHLDKDSITADPHDPNLVYAVWDLHKNDGNFSDSSIGGEQTVFARSLDGGQSWKPATVIFQSPDQSDFLTTGSIDHQILVLPDATLIDAFTEETFTKKVRFKDTLDILRSTDGGKSWSGPIVGPQEGFPDIRDPDTVNVFLAFVRGGQLLPEVAVDPNSGNLYAVWPDLSPLFPFGDISAIAFSMSSDGGFTWSSPIFVNQTPTKLPNPFNTQAFNASIAVGRDGTVAVSYYDFRFNDPNPGVPTDAWVAFGNPRGPGGLTNLSNWGNELRLTATSFNMENAPLVNGINFFLGDYQGLATAGNGFEAFFAVAGASPNTSSIFSRQILDPPPPPAAAVSDGGSQFDQHTGRAAASAATLILFPQTAPASAPTSAATEHPPAVPDNAVNPASADAAPDATLTHANTLASALPNAVAHLRTAALAQQISDSLFGGVAGDKLWAWES